jgi:competence protein ComEC
VGYRSRFGHPHGEVLGRYRGAGIDILRTDRDGAVQVRLTREGVQVTTERSSVPRYWRAVPSV